MKRSLKTRKNGGWEWAHFSFGIVSSLNSLCTDRPRHRLSLLSLGAADARGRDRKFCRFIVHSFICLNEEVQGPFADPPPFLNLDGHKLGVVLARP